MQAELYESNVAETYEKRLYRLSQKWLIEAELWLNCIIIIEIM
jgi:hypothetical protein